MIHSLTKLSKSKKIQNLSKFGEFFLLLRILLNSKNRILPSEYLENLKFCSEFIATLG